MQVNTGPFPTQKGRTLHNVHADPFKKILFVSVLPSRPAWLAHKQFGVPEVTDYGYSKTRVLRVLVLNLLCSSVVPALAKCSQTLVSDLPLTSCSTSLLTLPVQDCKGSINHIHTAVLALLPLYPCREQTERRQKKLNQEQFAGRLSAQVQTCLFVNGTLYKRHFLSSLVAVSP